MVWTNNLWQKVFLGFYVSMFHVSMAKAVSMFHVSGFLSFYACGVSMFLVSKFDVV